MDGTTEPVIAVIGNPIAGNPAQFAIERALLSMQLQWRVMSFDIPPERTATALDGLETLAFRGVLVDQSLHFPARDWYRDKGLRQKINAPVGCLFRDPDNADVFVADAPATRWLAGRIENHAQDHPIERAIWLGDRNPIFPTDAIEFVSRSARKKVSDPESISSYDLVVISSSKKQPLDLRVEDWLGDDGSTCVIDLTDGHPDQARIDALGYRLVTTELIRAGMICEAMRQWTKQAPANDVVQEAIEEYLAV